MAEAKLQESKSFRPVGLLPSWSELSTHMKWIDFIESIARIPMKKVCSLCRVRQFFSSDSLLDICQSTIHLYMNIAALSGFVLRLLISEFLTKSKVSVIFIGVDVAPRLQLLPPLTTFLALL